METHTHPEGYCYFYDELDVAIKGLGWPSIFSKFAVPTWILYPIAYLCLWFSMLTGIKIKLTPFTVTMMTMHRWFDCSASVRDLK
jgi:hypothetical protein